MKTSEVSAEVKKQPDETREKAQVNELLRSIQGETAPGKSGEIPAATDDLLRARLELRPRRPGGGGQFAGRVLRPP